MTNPAVRLRIALTAALVCYLAAIVVTGFVPLSPALDVPLALGGWLVLAGLVVWANLRRRRYSSRVVLRAIIWPAPLAAAFGVLLVRGLRLRGFAGLGILRAVRSLARI